MATTTYLSSFDSITIGGVDLTDQISSISFALGVTPLTSTAFGDTGERLVAGLQTVDGSVTLYASYGVGEVEETLFAEVGLGTTTIVITVAAGPVGPANPEYTISNCMLATVPSSATVGELQIFQISVTGGTWARAV